MYSVGNAKSGNLSISGNVKEYIDDTTLNSIENIKIELYDESNNEIQLYNNYNDKIDAIYSDENGNYKIINVANNNNQKYTVQFTYGTSEQLKISPKYNGHDYQTKDSLDNISNDVQVTDKTSEYYTEGKKVDIYFIIDCSGSMSNFITETKKELHEMLSTLTTLFGDDASIGLVAFGDNLDGSSTYPFKRFSTTKYKKYFALTPATQISDIESKINSLIASGNNYNSLTINATTNWILEEGREDSDKYIIILGDGIPKIGLLVEWEDTRLAYKNATNNGITMLSILPNKPILLKYKQSLEQQEETGNDNQEKEVTLSNNYSPNDKYIIDSFNKTDWYTCCSGYDILDQILYQYVLGNKEVLEEVEIPVEDNLSDKIEKYISTAKDDPSRRNEVDKYTNVIDNSLGNKIRTVFEDGKALYMDEVSSNTMMIAKAEIVTSKNKNNINNINLILEERLKNEISISQYITKIKLNLSNGTNIIDYTPNSEEKYLIDLGKGNSKMVILDNELVHGAELEVSYAITIKNTGNINNVEYTLLNYLDDFSFNYFEDKNGNIINNIWNRNNNNSVTTTIILNKNQEKTLDITLKKVLSSSSKNEFKNIVEVKEYKSIDGRRIYFTTPKNKIASESDISISELLSILPPFGKKNI